MSDGTICICRREKEIDELKEEVKRLRDIQYDDHAILARLEEKVDGMNNTMKTLLDEVKQVVARPGDRYEKLTIAGGASLVGAIIAYLFSILIGG